jgi:subtilisin family serine protease
MNEPEQPNRETAQPSGVSALPGRKHVLQVPDDILHRYNARVLDPSTAERIPGQPPVRSTVYVANQLIISGDASADALQKLDDVAAAKGLRVVADDDDCHARTHRVARESGRENDSLYFSRSVRLEPAGTGPAAPPDAWSVLQAYRAELRDDKAGQSAVALDHLLAATGGPDIGGVPYIGGHGLGGVPYIGGHGADGVPYIGGHGVGAASSEYGLPGHGGRAPVNWIGAPPHRHEELPVRRPVVAVLDTGIGTHPWLSDEIVKRNLFVQGVPLGIHDPMTDPEQTGVIDDPYEGVLDSDAGHGTFIAGLIHQTCPDADILAVRVMSSDGAVAESVLLDALKLLVLRHTTAQASGDASELVDVVSLSLGYYHEQPEDLGYDPQLLMPLRALSACGVVVVASAGNDSTSRPMFPAAFTPYQGGQIGDYDHDYVPLISVGARNPNRTIALFSNAGPWVSCHRPGAGLVSTFPTTINAGAEPAYRVDVPDDGRRETIDPDDFRSGFATWSGTSFAAPILAAELAQSMLDGDCGPLDATDAESCISRAWSAVFEQLGVKRP